MLPVRIEIYYVAGCPNRQTPVNRVKAVLSALGVVGELREVQINPNWASVLHFIGSPTVHVNGRDIEPSARTSNEFSVSCRTYREEELVEGAPSKKLIRQAILEASAPLRKTANH